MRIVVTLVMAASTACGGQQGQTVTPTAEKPRSWIEDGVQVIAIDHPVWCFDTADKVRMCAELITRCETYRDTINSVGECSAEDAMACVGWRNPVTGIAGNTCYASLANCRIARRAVTTPSGEAAQSGVVVTGSDCIVMRHTVRQGHAASP